MKTEEEIREAHRLIDTILKDIQLCGEMPPETIVKECLGYHCTLEWMLGLDTDNAACFAENLANIRAAMNPTAEDLKKFMDRN